MPRSKVPEGESPQEAAIRRTRTAAVNWDEQTRRFTRSLTTNTKSLTKKQRTELQQWLDERFDGLSDAAAGRNAAPTLFSDNGSEE